ncbi:MAG: beta strand repeat-containing protein [Chthoniobacterales bacterium]
MIGGFFSTASFRMRVILWRRFWLLLLTGTTACFSAPRASAQSWADWAEGQTIGSFFGVASSGTTTVAVGIDGRIATRNNQTGNWTVQTFSGDPDFRAVIYASGQFATVREGGEIRTSADGINWTLRTSGTTNDLRAIIHDGSKFVVAGQNGTILTSSNGVSWTTRNSGTTTFFNSLSFSGSRYVAVGGYGVRWSVDAVTWTAPASPPPSISFEASTWTGSRFVVGGLGFGSTATLYGSSDGSSWALLNSQVRGNVEAAVTVGTDLYIAGDNTFVMRSQDNGQTWTNIYTNATGSEYFMALAYDAQSLIAAGFNHNVWARSLTGAPNSTPTPTSSSATYNISFGSSNLSSTLSFAGGLLKLGAGSLILSGGSNNTYSGLTTVEEGALVAAKSGALGVPMDGTLVANGAALQLSNNISIVAESLFLNGAGLGGTGSLRNLSGTNFYQGPVSLLSPSLITATAGLLALGTTVNAAGFGLSFSNASTATITVAGPIDGIGSTVSKLGSGTLILQAGNNYSGLTEIKAGAIRIANAGALGTTASRTEVASGSALELIDSITVRPESLLLNGTGIGSGGALRSISGNNAYEGTITNASATRINSDAGTLTLSGAINANNQSLTFGGAGNTSVKGSITNSSKQLTKDGVGTISLHGANSYTGMTSIRAGVLEVNSGSAIADTGVVFLDNYETAVFLVSASETIGSLVGGSWPASTARGNVIIASGQALTIAGTTSESFFGSITGAGSLVKSGSGTVTLWGSSSFTGGVRLSRGALILGDNRSLGTGAFTIGDGTVAAAYYDTRTVSNEVTMGGNVTFGGSIGMGDLIFSNIDLAGVTRTFTVVNHTTIAGVISNSGPSTVALIKAGTGTMTLSGPNTYSGATVVNGGVLRVRNLANSGASSALGTGTSVTLRNDGMLDYIGLTNTSMNRNLVLSSGNGILGVSADSATLTLNGGISGAGSLVKRGVGTLHIAERSTYTGNTTVNGGTLLINNSGSIGEGALTVNSGATLAGNGSIASSAWIDGTHAPGGNVGVQTFLGDLTYRNLSSVSWELVSNTDSAHARGTEYDGVDVRGQLAFEGSVALNLLFNSLPSTVDWNDSFWSGNRSWRVYQTSLSNTNTLGLQFGQSDWSDSTGKMLSATRGEFGSRFFLASENNNITLNYKADAAGPTIALSPGIDKVTWVPVGASVVLTDSDVIATDADTFTPQIVIDPVSINTQSDSLTTVTYTATDASGNSSTFTRVIAVGSAGPSYHNLRFPTAKTINTLSSDYACGEIYIENATTGAGAASGVQAWIGVNSNNTDPSTWDDSVWTAADYIGEEGNNDNYQGQISGTGRPPGTYYYATRFQLGTNNSNYFFGGIGTDGVGGAWGAIRDVNVDSNGVINVVTYTNGSGVLTVQAARQVTFAVDMNVQTNKSLFDPATQGVEVRGSFDGWAGGSALTNSNNSGIYIGTFVVGGNEGSAIEYKFYRTGSDKAAYEGLTNNRTYSLRANGVDVTVPTIFFNDDDGIGPVIALNGVSPMNLTVGDTYTELGATATDAIDGIVTATPTGSVDTTVAGTYTVTYNASDAAGNAAITITRTVIVAAANPYDSWTGQNNLTGADALPTADPDNDGFNNQQEFGFGTNPNQGNGTLLTASVSGDTFIVTWLAKKGFNYSVVQSQDLTTGLHKNQTLTDNIALASDQAGVPNGYERKQVTVPITSERNFLALAFD